MDASNNHNSQRICHHVIDTSQPMILAVTSDMCAVPPHPDVLQKMWRKNPPTAQRRRGIAGIGQRLMAAFQPDVVTLPEIRPLGLGDGVIYPTDDPRNGQVGFALLPALVPAQPLRVIVVLA